MGAVDFAIVGTGFSGLCMAIQLARQGRNDFILLEKESELGGTWRDNHYPGCACDIPSRLYSFSFAPNPNWTRSYAPQAEILNYLHDCAARWRIGPHIRFGREVTSARFDSRGWWRIQAGEETLRARHLVLGTGALSRPSLPRFPGADAFAGRVMHSSRWDHSFDLRGKRVGVIGTGASAIQLVPRVADQARSLVVFQRTPSWILPRPDRPIPPIEQRVIARAPQLQALARYGIYWWLELRGGGFTVDSRWMTLAASLGKHHLARQVRDPGLRRKLTPDYTPGCKRILLANDYYPALTRDHVELVTEPIECLTERGVRTSDGALRELDVLVYATGFRVTDPPDVEIRGRGNRDLIQSWAERVQAYRGTFVSGFPNLYLLMGPNTGLGHSSMIFMIEAQVHHILQYERALKRAGKAWADVRPEVEQALQERLEDRLRKSVWASGCKSWYLDARGHNASIWPGFTFEFWLGTRFWRPADFEWGPPARQWVPDTTHASPEAVR